MNDKLSFGKVFVLGFALFAMFFGAGNLIFPRRWASSPAPTG